MKQNLIHFLLAVMLLALSSNALAQIAVKGHLVDSETGEPLVGVTVMIQGTTQGTVTDVDGLFQQNVTPNAVLQFKYVGYKELTKKITQRGPTVDLGIIEMQPDAVLMKDVVITSSMAVARKTPVAVSTVSSVLIEEKLGTMEFPEILKSTPGVHANKQGGGYGDSEIYVRGFEPANTGVMINGVPMNDMEWGGIYWSNWAGLTDVTSNMQSQRGLGAAKVSVPSVGGTINIVTKGLDADKGGTIAYSMGNDGMNKILFSVSSGLSKNGWAFTILGSKQWGDGYIQGTEYTGYSYFVNIAKRINDNHQLSLTAFGAPQEHDQRSDGLFLSTWEMTRNVYGVKDYRYNPSFGYRSNGQAYNAEHNVYHKPQISLNHQWQIDHKSSLSTVVYVSLGRGYGYAGEANGAMTDYTYQSWYGAYQGNLYTTFRNNDGTFDYAAIETINANSDCGSAMIMSKSKNFHNWVGLLSTYTSKIGKDIDFYGGIDFRYYKGTHTNEIQDLFGGQYYIDETRIEDVDEENNANAASDAWRYEKLGVGDVIYRDYDSHIIQGGAFFQGEYTTPDSKLTATVGGSVNNTAYWRYDRLYYDKTHARSETVNYWGGTIKGGANYNLNDNHNVFFNAGFLTRAPKFSSGAFLSSTYSNTINPNAKNEKVVSLELGYGFHNSWASININGYFTKWIDKTLTKTTTLRTQETGYVNMEGVNALHKGVELDIKLKPAYWIEVTGMLSIGDWKWDNTAKGYMFTQQGYAVDSDGNQTTPGADDHAWAMINMEGVRVGGSAQTTAALGVNLNVTKELRIGADWNYYGRNYAYYSLSGSNLSVGKENTVLDPWRIPAASQFDVNASYRFTIAGLKATLSGNVNNLFNYLYISKAYNPGSSSSATSATKDNIYGWYAFGRTFTVRLKVNF